ncbi:MAG: hypothetical protein K2X93_02315 [Candidatus Obscuribacterales bacterium]|nr:hypothetical protein [Candidatus Obscuribacterales bacterium]
MQYFCFILFALACWYFWRSAWKLHVYYSQKDGTSPLPQNAAFLFFTCVSMVSGLVIGDVSKRTPDLLAGALYVFGNGAILSCLFQKNNESRFALTGIFMGLAYLTKSFFVSWSIPCIALMRWRGKDYGFQSIKSMLLLLVPLALLAALYVVPLSISLGRPTIGESGKYQLIFCTTENLLPSVPLVHGSRETLHPARILFEDPKVYEFDKPFSVTYSPWFNPHYWNDGIKIEINWPLFWAMLAEKAMVLVYSFGIYVGVLWLYLVVTTRTFFPFSLDRIKTLSPIICCAWLNVVVLLVVTVWPRYLIGLIPPIFAGIILCFRYKSNNAAKCMAQGLSILSVLMLLSFSWQSFMHCFYGFPELRAVVSKMTGASLPSPAPDAHSATANKLKELGVQPGDKVARIAKQEFGEFYWARLAEVRIVCESVDPDGFFKAAPNRRTELYEKLRALGVKAIVLDWSYRAPPGIVPNEPGWQPVEGTKSLIRPLNK